MTEHKYVIDTDNEYDHIISIHVYDSGGRYQDTRIRVNGGGIALKKKIIWKLIWRLLKVNLGLR